MEEYTNFSLYQIYLTPSFWFHLDTSYRGSSQTSGNRTEPLRYGEGCQATEKCVIAKDALVWFAIAGKYTGSEL